MIFNFIKSKPTLKEIIPNGFVDIHSHILPGIDDGAKDINESLLLISEMKQLGFSKITLVLLTTIIIFAIYQSKNFNLDASSDALLLEGDPDLKYLR